MRVPRIGLALLMLLLVVAGGLTAGVVGEGGGGGSSGSGGAPGPSGDGAVPAGAGGRVTRVVDGDTVHVRDGSGDDVTVRLALVDAPESSALRYGRAECGGAQATAALRRLVDGRVVSFRRPGGEDEDRYGRQVAELVVDGRSVDERLIADGWAKQYRVPRRDGGSARNAAIARIAATARREQVGVWRACGGFGRAVR